MTAMTLETDDDSDPSRPLRADAVRNRSLILKTAATLFTEQGIDVGYDEIARRAGVGVGTVYRRFPERSELVLALFETRIDQMVGIGRAALEWPDAWDGLTWFLTTSLERQVADRGLKEVMMRAVADDGGLVFSRNRIAPLLDALTHRAQADGALRRDVGATDIAVQLLIISSMSVPEQPDLWRRHLALFLEAIQARPGQPNLDGCAPSEEAMFAVMSRMHGGRR